MKKSIVLFFTALLTITAFAQSIQEGTTHLNAERYASAQATFEKMLATNPNNLEAAYWLGQTHIGTENLAAARSVYDKALASNGNAPLLLVGMGHVQLMEGKTAEARQNFEQAISLSRGKKGDNPEILNLIGRANVDAKQGDIPYAIEKLKTAVQLSPNNSDIYINLGNAYRRAKEGGLAASNYIRAYQLNPNTPVPYYRLALLYKTQRNWDIVLENLNKAVQIDPKFAPAYMQMYEYNLLYKQDFNAASQNASQYIASADPSVENDYLQAQTKFVQKDFPGAISIGRNIISKAGERVNARVLRMMAYATLENRDTTAARQYIDQFFGKVPEEDIVAQDYTLKADIYAKEDPSVVAQLYVKAAQTDSILNNQLIYLQQGIEKFKAAGKRLFEADLRLAAYHLRPDPDPDRLVHIGLAYYFGGGYKRADSVFTAYTKAAPDSIFGYLWSARSLAKIDTTMEQGLAVPAYEKLIEVSLKDKERYKSYGVEASGYLAGYYNNIKKDRNSAITYLQKGLEFDPNNSAIQNNLKILQSVKQQPGSKTSGNTKAASSSSSKK